MSDRFYREYTREDRAFIELEEKIGSTTDATIEVKRRWFMDKFDHAADDETVNIAWEREYARND